jgi:hypothetical protein
MLPGTAFQICTNFCSLLLMFWSLNFSADNKLHLLEGCRVCSHNSHTHFQKFCEKNYGGLSLENVPRVKVSTSGYNSRGNSESEMLHTHGSNFHLFLS